MKKEQLKNPRKIGLVAGYKPNPISFYILLLQCGRLDELLKKLYKDMEIYKEDNQMKLYSECCGTSHDDMFDYDYGDPTILDENNGVGFRILDK